MMWVWWMTQLAFIFLVEIFRYVAIGFLLFWVAKVVLRKIARR